MAGIYVDPTETRARTRLPDDVIRQAKELPGLEHLTGSDILIAIDNPPVDVRDLAKDEFVGPILALYWEGRSPQQIAIDVEKPLPFVLKVLKFKKACMTGLLSQRKTARDICSIITNSRGAIILSRMRLWCPECWLTIVDARVERDRKGKLLINGEKMGFYYNQLDGALDAWARRGGFIKWVPRDKDLMLWLAKQLDYLRTRTEEKVLDLRQPVQKVIGPSDDRGSKIAVLASLRHMGVGKAKLLLEHFRWNLGAALEALLDPSIVLSKDRPKGIGKKTVTENRLLFGLEEDWVRFRVVVERKEE